MNQTKFSILILLITLTGCAGMERTTDGGKPIETVLDIPGKTKSQLFSASKSWIAETFVSGKAVMDDADKDSGRIIAKGRTRRPCEPGLDCIGRADYLIGFTLRIDAKDDKLRTTYTNLTVISPAKPGKMAGVIYVAGSPESEHEIIFASDLNAARKALTYLNNRLHQYVTNDSVENW